MTSNPAGPWCKIARWNHQLLFQPEEEVVLGWRVGDAVVHDWAEIISPNTAGKRAVCLQHPARDRCWPGDNRLIARVSDGQDRRAGCLHGKKRPKAAGDRIIAAAHGRAGIRLADGAGDRINATRACAATTGDLIPVNRVRLGEG